MRCINVWLVSAVTCKGEKGQLKKCLFGELKNMRNEIP